MRKSGSGRANEVAHPYVQTAFRRTTRAGAGIRGISSAGNLKIAARPSVVAELAQQRARFPFHVLDLVGGEVLAPASDRAGVHARERLRQRPGVRLESCGDPLRRPPGLRGELLVAELRRALRRRPCCLEIATPGPGRPRRLARAAELIASLLLDPEARVGPVRKTGIVAAPAAAGEPALLEQRANDVAPRADDEAQFRRLLHGAQVAHEPEPAHTLQRPPQFARCLRLGQRGPAFDPGLHRPDLAQVDESRLRADGAGQEGRPRTWRADDEDDPLGRQFGIAAFLAP